MHIVTLLGTLKREGPSNTEALAEFFSERSQANGCTIETVRLARENVITGTSHDEGSGDAWPGILAKLEKADAVIFATPVWWGSHSSEIQRVIERLDAVHDEILGGKTSRLYGKAFGVIVTGDSDGAEHIIGTFANFANAIGMTFPPYATLTVLNDKHAKGKNVPPDELRAFYEKDYAKAADAMAQELARAVR